MLTGKVIKEKNGSLTVHCSYKNNNNVIIPLDLDQWGIASRDLIGKEVAITEIMEGGGYVAHIVLPHSDSNAPLVTEADAEEFAKQAFHAGRMISRMENNTPVFKFPSYSDWLKSRK